MRTFVLACMMCLVTGLASAASISGEYFETRNCNMWAGPCLSNGEAGLTGDKAVLAWKVNYGSYDGIQLDGMSVVAVVFGDRTFGLGDHAKTQTMFLVDSRATGQQRDALMAMAKALAKETIQDVAVVKAMPIKMDVALESDSGYAALDAGTTKIRTRTLKESDNSCGVEMRMAYPVLAKISQERPAFTMVNDFAGSELLSKFVKYNYRDMRSSVIGKFSL